MISVDDDSSNSSKPFLDHLEDLRVTIIWCAVSLAAGMAIAVPLAPSILRLLKIPLEKSGKNPESFLKILQIAGGFSIAMKIIFWSGVLISIPCIVFFICRFVFPGLTRSEKKNIFYASIFSGVFFAAGVCMGYFITLPVAIEITFRINNWLGVPPDFVELGSYISFVLKLLIAFGCVFELPVIIFVLGSMGIVTSDQLRSKRRYVIIGILILAMILTPPDPFTQILMALPMIALYECCIWLVILKKEIK